MSSKDDLGDRMKSYEARETQRLFFPTLPVYARIDGRGFSKFTKGMKRPYDPHMTQAMIDVTAYLVKETQAIIGYTQSDEISLVWQAADYTSDIFFGGKVQKMCSVVASMTAAKFAQLIRGWTPYEDRLPAFDTRIIQLPNETEAANMFLWRNLDATRNSITMAAQSVYSHKQLHKKTQKDMLRMMEEAGHDYPAHDPSFRLGTFLRRKNVSKVGADGELILRTNIEPESVDYRTLINRTEYLFDFDEAVYNEAIL